MSSLAATQADGYYLPPEYFESGAYRKLTRNQWQAKQSGAAKPKQIPVVRFELPCSGSCTGCGHFILKGTRYNAEKIKTGEKYLSSPIWEFRMKCRNCCETVFAIRTNPQLHGFDYLKGIQKQQRHIEERKRPLPTSTKSDSEEEGTEILDRLETIARGKRKAMSEIDQLQSLKQNSERCFLQDSDMNATIRASFRVERKDRKRQRKAAEALGFREGISLADHSLEDEVTARQTTFGNCRRSEKKKMSDARKKSIFSTKKKSSSGRKKDRRNSSEPVVPDGIPSSSPSVVISATHNTTSATTCTSHSTGSKDGSESSEQQNDPGTGNIQKKILVVTQQRTTLMPSKKIGAETTTGNCGSALDALADYGSDSS
ncbi:coil domain-containing protein 130 homolog [Seminavis robusta]|uniref:Coil domain-containing protein 130 homolog n=1 Tax=Seminavis robusta TaxID=568900 RepID=A0A9N8EHI0_9STRA|nr:coil domain-containing protein 130 homolog [Seminavis robusta]|eukprot:Sro1012_g231130.1 coil domain-containing protein 130 homolog (372) ;mRNA; f:6009-7124